MSVGGSGVRESAFVIPIGLHLRELSTFNLFLVEY